MNKVCIVIPVYNEQPQAHEIKSISQCFRILSGHRFIFISHHNFEYEAYKQIANEYSVEYNTETFDNRFFANVDGYNSLLISGDFYAKFRMCDYMLIYQTDSWVFFDKLTEWCLMGYDYVAAPWIDVWWLAGHKRRLMKESLRSKNLFGILLCKISWLKKGYYKKRALNVGNGGFSLRKISSFLQVCGQAQSVKIPFPNEDVFWSIYVPLNFDFKIPAYIKAAAFSADVNPEVLFKINKKELPMGCHAWCRTDHPYEKNYAFWEKIIDTYKDEII